MVSVFTTTLQATGLCGITQAQTTADGNSATTLTLSNLRLVSG
uniref:Uncharacterized protein n=1 Tax=Cyanothece sp. (strain PCC 7425 / ATCC 29141) TaxID=395961 RepID=B8HN42_CYAP4